ncbi:MSMEG_1061 family FMN-dependent PPOX-type flavoprotein [Azospirillum picis]|uniref:PPOX class probable FMN-dependent enzyme n=1 Tax=Azospirillum picis TaxID=488438 RepID=A0ABU0MHK5_9PROT|nr:MSMEG_1061 family FMN-dependent PPOX-type flavoprotein [Azospirillum picis]MBP2298828.1 PPOX class probable FMN-dependent enzyme [Azospirillum picis]MDQ0532930.1 PPOX class probable FMN-dependent enzyme [Azospirillum picis]
MDPHRICTIEELRRHYDQPTERLRRSTLSHLDDHSLRFIAAAPLVFIATMSDAGMDCSPRGGRPGFVRASNRRELAIPDWPGNNKLASIENILASDGACGLVFLVPGQDLFLRVNGTATVTMSPDLLALAAEGDRKPKAVVRLAVAEAFFHCGKALRRSHLWQPDQWVIPADMPTPGQVVKDQTGFADLSVEEIDALYRQGLAADLYGGTGN